MAVALQSTDIVCSLGFGRAGGDGIDSNLAWAEARFRTSGRVDAVTIPAAELAIATHRGHHSEADRTYGLLAAHVAEHALAVEGPLREYYPVGRRETADPTRWRTEIGWPIFHLGADPPDPIPRP